MDEIKDVVYNALVKYYTILGTTGQMPDNKVDSLIVLVGLYFMLDNMYIYLTDNDLGDILRALNCIEGNCLIEFPDFLIEDTLSLKQRIRQLRMSEDELLRLTENSLFRIPEI